MSGKEYHADVKESRIDLFAVTAIREKLLHFPGGKENQTHTSFIKKKKKVVCLLACCCLVGWLIFAILGPE